jgi:hypothetical protein
MNQRKPLSRGFYPIGLLVMPLVGVAFASIDILFMNRPPRVFLLAALGVVPLHLVQLFLDHRHTETWYRPMTSPPYHLTQKQLLAMQWPSLLVFLPMPSIGVIPVAAVFIGCLVLYYPWQRSLYLRSRHDFGSHAQNA